MMRRVMLMLCLLLVWPLMAAADSATVTFTPMPEAEAIRFLKNAMPALWTEDYVAKPIQCFDVRADGMIALGFNRREGKYAVVLDRDGVFQYGIAFRATGSFLLRWTDEGLGVIWIRSGVMGIFDDAGKCVGLYEYEPDSTFSRYANMLSQPARRAGKDSFILRNDHPLGALALNWGQLVRTDSLGNEVVLHDASAAAALSTVGVIMVTAFVAGCVIISLRRVRRGR